MTEGPVQINMYGIRYFINGDLSDPYVKKLMVQARNDLQQMKNRNINNIPHTWLNKPNAYKIVSQFGIDSAYINVPFGGEQHKKIEWEEKKERKDLEAGLYPAFEIFDSSKTKIGYAICLSGTFAPPYHLVITDNVIDAYITKEDLAIARENNPAITVDPFYFPVWKYQYAGDYGDPEARPFDEEVLKNKEIIRNSTSYPNKTEEIVYTDIACTFEELILINNNWPGDSTDSNIVWSDIDLFYLPVYALDEEDNHCIVYYGTIYSYNGNANYMYDEQYPLVTKTGWTNSDSYSELDALSTHPYRGRDENVEYTGCFASAGFDEGAWPLIAGGCTFVLPNPEDCDLAADCSSGCWDLVYETYCVPDLLDWQETGITIIINGLGSPNGSEWYYHWVNDESYQEYYETEWGSNAYDINSYAAYFEYATEEVVRIRDREPSADTRELFTGVNIAPLAEEDFWATPVRLDPTDTTTYDYTHHHYIEVNGPAGKKTKTIHQANDAGTGISASDVNLRYYKLGEESYWVLGTLWLNNPEWDDDQLLHIVYKSGQGFLEDTIFWDERKYSWGDVFYLYEIDENLKAPNGGPVLADGSFRLIRVEKETKYPDEIKKYEQQLY